MTWVWFAWCSCGHSEGVHASTGWRGCSLCSEPTKYDRDDPRFGCLGYVKVRETLLSIAHFRWVA